MDVRDCIVSWISQYKRSLSYEVLQHRPIKQTALSIYIKIARTSKFLYFILMIFIDYLRFAIYLLFHISRLHLFFVRSSICLLSVISHAFNAISFYCF